MVDKCGKRQRKHLGGVILNEDVIKDQLEELVDSINSRLSSTRIEFNQQPKTKGNMSITGCNGRMFVQPSVEGYDVSLSGKSLENEMHDFLCKLFGKECDGYKQTNTRLGKKSQPFWRVSDFQQVVEAVYRYTMSHRSD